MAKRKKKRKNSPLTVFGFKIKKKKQGVPLTRKRPIKVL